MKPAKLILIVVRLALLYAIVAFVYLTPRAFLLNQFDASPAVLTALAHNKPILGLESTIITHGLSYPTNVETQLNLQRIALSFNVTPATIAVVGGRVTVGLTDEQIRNLALAKNVVKASTHDLQYVRAFNRTASTTVAATTNVAGKAKIAVFATGGIGGVHKFADKYEFDVSADLSELAKSDTIVVSAGCKAILDLRGTAEVLETLQVLVAGYQTKEMPAFYSRKSGIMLDYSVAGPEEAAQLYMAGNAGKRGYLLFNPIPEKFEIPREKIDPFIDRVIKEMPADVKGKAVTPYLLKRMSEVTGNASVTANLALIENNVLVGSMIAAEISKKQFVLPNPILMLCAKLQISCLFSVFISLIIVYLSLGIVIRMHMRRKLDRVTV